LFVDFTELSKFTKTLEGLCSDKGAAMSGDVHGSVEIAVEDTNMDIKEEEFLIDTSEEDFHGDVTSHTVKAEEDTVSHVCFSIIRYIL
jgi:hypothetical protein